MGEKTEPVKLYIETDKGEYIPIPSRLPELTLTESEETEMSCAVGCRFCQYSDENRRKDDKIRCKRWSQWVKPIGKVCKEYSQGFTFTMPQKGAEDHE